MGAVTTIPCGAFSDMLTTYTSVKATTPRAEAATTGVTIAVFFEQHVVVPPSCLLSANLVLPFSPCAAGVWLVTIRVRLGFVPSPLLKFVSV